MRPWKVPAGSELSPAEFAQLHPQVQRTAAAGPGRRLHPFRSRAISRWSSTATQRPRSLHAPPALLLVVKPVHLQGQRRVPAVGSQDAAGARSDDERILDDRVVDGVAHASRAHLRPSTGTRRRCAMAESHQLSVSACESLLRSHQVGRVAVSTPAGPHIVPDQLRRGVGTAHRRRTSSNGCTPRGSDRSGLDRAAGPGGRLHQALRSGRPAAGMQLLRQGPRPEPQRPRQALDDLYR